MQPAYSPPVSPTSPVKLNRRANLASLMTGPSAIINPTDLARAMGRSTRVSATKAARLGNG